ncbi:hypothetical protein L596_024748 [Steinernema carpocapsae]|uniref:Secreted protein n=1 Tax=Steinernema carpocapsae TaxID=34508 RepID=A0A4U5M5M8_STECR|nr:hypothetical protein L596_024748 [Steinernema carpocapsae]
MFASRYLLLFCFFTALCTNATKNANERACDMPSLAKTPGLQRNTQTLFTRLANPARPSITGLNDTSSIMVFFHESGPPISFSCENPESKVPSNAKSIGTLNLKHESRQINCKRQQNIRNTKNGVSHFAIIAENAEQTHREPNSYSKRKKSAIPLSVFEKTRLPRVMQPVGGGCIILGRTRHSSWVANYASRPRFTRGLYKHFATVQPLAFRRGGLFPRASRISPN